MLREELEAEQNLVKLSQATSYIFEWQHSKLKVGRGAKMNKETIEEEAQNYHKRINKRNIPKQISEKYDLRKWESRAASFNKIQYPLLNQNLFDYEDQYVLPKCRLSNNVEPTTSVILPRRRGDINRQIYKAIEEGVVKKKLEKFKKRMEELQKNIVVEEVRTKVRCFPKRIFNKKQGKSVQPLTNRQQQRLNEQQIQNFKKMLTKKTRRLSLPNLIKLGEKLPMINEDHIHF